MDDGPAPSLAAASGRSGGPSRRGDGTSSFGESLSTMFGAGGGAGGSQSALGAGGAGNGAGRKAPASFKMPVPTAKDPVPDYAHFWLMEARVINARLLDGSAFPDIMMEVLPKVQHGLSARIDVGPEAGVGPQPRGVKDFKALRAMLGREVPGAIVPPLPAWCSAPRFGPDDASEPNCAALAEFLNRCFQHEDLQTSHTLKVFCLAPPDAWTAVGAFNKGKDPHDNVGVQMKAAYENLKEAVGVKTEEELVVDSPFDKEVQKQLQWVTVLEAELTKCVKAASALQTTREQASADVEALAGALGDVLGETDTRKEIGLEKDAIGAAVGEPKPSTEATKTLVESISEFLGTAQAAHDAIKRRDELRLKLQAARVSHASHVKSSAKREEVEAAHVATSEKADNMVEQGGPARSGPAATLSSEQKVKIRLVFQQFDQDKTNNIDVAELKLAFHVLGKPPRKNEMDIILKRFQKEKKSVVSLDEFMELAAPLVAGRASSESTLDGLQFQMELFYVQLLAAYHHAMKGFMSSEEHVKEAQEAMQLFEKKFSEADKRLAREMAKFEIDSKERLQSMSAIFVTLEYKLVAKRKGSLKKVATDLGASLTDPDDVRSSAAANPMLQKLHAGFEDMGDAP